MKNNQTILGIMSGTSLDGLDFALCRFSENNGKYNFEIIKTGMYSYPESWQKHLSEAQYLNAFDFIKLHKKYGEYIGKQTNIFLKNTEKPDYIASHGHTIFHKPDEKITFQIGDGAFIAAETGISVISDFRTLDTALGGQGAPLVPVGDKLLFSDYDFCINLGGFANISYDNSDNKRIAFDICPVNFIVNDFSKILGFEFDKDGEIGKSGKINTELLTELNDIKYYSENPPKSLGREYVENIFIPIFNKFDISTKNKIRTIYEHITLIINKVTQEYKKGKILFTGGGTHNKFLMQLIKKHNKHEIIIPENEIIDFKEAIIFGFLGFLRIRNENNCLKSVTGAKIDNCGGNIITIH